MEDQREPVVTITLQKKTGLIFANRLYSGCRPDAKAQENLMNTGGEI
jgi:hypothetical protein